MFYYLVSLLKSPLNPLTYQSSEKLNTGALVHVSLNKKEMFGVILESVERPSFTCEAITLTCNEFFPHETVEIAKFIAEYYVCSLGEALALFVPCSELSTSIKDKLEIDIMLSSEQQKAYAFIEHHESSLLFGDTGSGKTEIYMKLFEACINKGKSALFLLPEIGLTPQMKRRLKHHFGSHVAIWHSKVSAKKKAEILKGLEEGTISIIAGTRSALFLPIAQLGLIVVDEEHDESYKSSSRPRYNARDLALLFGQRQGIKVLLGSATPSLVSFYKVPYVRLKGTYHTSKNSFFYDDNHNELSAMVMERIQKTLNKGQQAVVFLPTRANFKYITCKECGSNIECPFCSVGMSLHQNAHALKCHYCNYTEAIPQVCPKCGCKEIVATRIGTAEVSSRLSEYFKDFVVQQFDRDVVSTEKKLSDILERFNDKKIDILVGTQMLSKGHDYHGVGLAVILGIDALLSMSDFRAREKALSLVQQIAGRAGRKGHGEVLVQTHNTEFFQTYLSDFEQFLRDELAYRKQLYPPFKKMMRLMASHVKEEKAQALIEKVNEHAKHFKKVEIVGFGKSTIGKIANKYRFELLARSDSTKALLELAHHVKTLHVEVDMDPLSFS
ncbi:MAG: primosomal protein N' [Sulfurospirillaceae bacterium]|nr:primosomal protein N' [Sulfurospirillaceae bacterium]MDD2827594.1 primosomal protein N' [Sulfurospirillaceae bacterium]